MKDIFKVQRYSMKAASDEPMFDCALKFALWYKALPSDECEVHASTRERSEKCGSWREESKSVESRPVFEIKEAARRCILVGRTYQQTSARKRVANASVVRMAIHSQKLSFALVRKVSSECGRNIWNMEHQVTIVKSFVSDWGHICMVLDVDLEKYSSEGQSTMIKRFRKYLQRTGMGLPVVRKIVLW